MVSVIRRTRHLRSLLAIRLGPGAAVLPPNVAKIEMDFAKKFNDGHMGPRKFWHAMLPRLKYHNPRVSMPVHRTDNQEGPATMTVHFTDNASPATINMKHRRDSEILSQLLSIAKAFPVTPTPDELEQIRILEEQQALSERDSARHIAHNLAEKRKQDLLKQARSA